MQRIRKRPRLDALVNQKRGGRPVSWGSRVYLGLMGLLGLAILNYFAGDALILRADGIVLAERTVVAATYPAKVVAVRVREGESVAAGQVLLDLESSDMLKDIADLASRNLDLSLRQAQLRTRQATLASVLPLAERRAAESSKQARRIDSMAEGGLVPADRLQQALSSRLDSAERFAELAGQSGTVASELGMVEAASQRSSEALAQLEAFYENGHVRAARSGVIGARVPMPGQVVRFGDELMQINGRSSYVLAYLPDWYLFHLKVGDRVFVQSGASGATATVEAILSVADALPAEFQNMFRPRDRSRLLRLALPPDNPFAISQKVSIGGCALGWCWTS